jgi:hypothetical protein
MPSCHPILAIFQSSSSQGFWSDDDLGIQWDDGTLWVKATRLVSKLHLQVGGQVKHILYHITIFYYIILYYIKLNYTNLTHIKLN